MIILILDFRYSKRRSNVRRKHRFCLKLVYRRFRGHWSRLDFRNSKWRIQYVGEKFEKSSKLISKLVSEVFAVADDDFAIRLSQLKMADAI